MKKHPKVTVFIPVYNRDKFIGETIESVLAQSYTDFELLIVDDGSTDRTIEVIQSYQDPRIRLKTHGKNLGIPATRNKGLAHARGQYIAILDSDDLAHPERLTKQVSFLDQNPDYVQIGTWCQMIDEHSNKLRRVRKQPTSYQDVHAHLLFRCALTNRSIMGRTHIFQEYGYHPDFPRCQDYDLHVRLSKKFKMGNLPEYLVYGRIHDQQITQHTQEIGNKKKKEIVERQLQQLGISYNDQDLAHHLVLSRIRKSHFIPDTAYLEWADQWLSGIQKANDQTSVYPQDALTRLLRKLWFRTCWAANPKLGTAFLLKSAWSNFRNSTPKD